MPRLDDVRRHLATMIWAGVLALATPWLAAGRARAQEAVGYGPNLEAFAYPYPVQRFALTSQGQSLSMAYMDVASPTPNGRTAVLLHGKNFTAATWEGVIARLAGAGFRVIAVDQIGFGKSTKPDGYQFSFQQLAANTRALVASLGVARTVVIGHSTGGMLGTRYALMYPDSVERLVLVDPIGLEDWKAKGVPASTIDAWTEREMRTTPESLRRYEQESYYAGTWRPEYDRWVGMYAGQFSGAGRALVARVTARIDEMIYTQPVVYELGLLRVPTLLMIGEEDRTAPGRDLAPPALRAELGDYPRLGREAAAAIPGSRLITFPGLGHAPFVQDPAAFDRALLDALR